MRGAEAGPGSAHTAQTPSLFLPSRRTLALGRTPPLEKKNRMINVSYNTAASLGPWRWYRGSHYSGRWLARFVSHCAPLQFHYSVVFCYSFGTLVFSRGLRIRCYVFIYPIEIYFSGSAELSGRSRDRFDSLINCTLVGCGLNAGYSLYYRYVC